MSPSIIPREQVAGHFAVDPSVLIRFESRGLVQPVREGSTEGYGPTEIRRVWSILSLQRDLGVNLAGVEAILRLKAHMETLHQRLETLAAELQEALDAQAEEEGHV